MTRVIPNLVPGHLQKMVNYYYATAPKPNDFYAMSAALELGSITMAKNFCTNESNFAGLNLLRVGVSGCGRSQASHAVERVTSRMSKPPYQHNGFRSAQAVINSISMREGSLCQLLSINIQPKVIEALTDVYKKQTEMFDPCQYTSKVDSFYNPNLTLVSRLSEHELRHAIKSNLDFVSTFLVAYAGPVAEVFKRPYPDTQPQKTLIEWCDWVSIKQQEPMMLNFSDACYDLLESYSDEVNLLRDQYNNAQTEQILDHVIENTKRIALIIAVSCESYVIAGEHMSWAINHTRAASWQMAAFVNSQERWSEVAKTSQIDMQSIAPNSLALVHSG